MAGYSLTVVRPTRIGRMAAPSDGELRAAQAAEAALTQQMTQPGANQMIGYRFAAEQNRLDAARDYDLAVQQHGEMLAAMREEDRRRAVEDRDFNARRAIITSGINNPAGLSAITAPEVEGLIDPERRQMYGELLRESIDARGRQYQLRPGSGRTPDTGEVRPRDQARFDETHNRNIDALIQRERNALRTEEGRIRSTVFGTAAQERAINDARQRAEQRVRELEGQRRRPGAPAAAPQAGGSGGGGAGDEQQQQPPTTTAAPNRQQMIDAARRHLANSNITPQQRDAIRQRLQQNGINPDTMQ